MSRNLTARLNYLQRTHDVNRELNEVKDRAYSNMPRRLRRDGTRLYTYIDARQCVASRGVSVSVCYGPMPDGLSIVIQWVPLPRVYCHTRSSGCWSWRWLRPYVSLLCQQPDNGIINSSIYAKARCWSHRCRYITTPSFLRHNAMVGFINCNNHRPVTVTSFKGWTNLLTGCHFIVNVVGTAGKSFLEEFLRLWGYFQIFKTVKI